MAQGYRYLVFVHPDAAASLYRRDVWQRLQVDKGTLDIWRRSARFYLKAFDVCDELRATRLHVADTTTMTAPRPRGSQALTRPHQGKPVAACSPSG